MSLDIKIDYRLEILKSMMIQRILISETEKQTKACYNQYFIPYFEQSLTKSLREYNSRFSSDPQPEIDIQEEIPEAKPDLLALEKKT